VLREAGRKGQGTARQRKDNKGGRTTKHPTTKGRLVPYWTERVQGAARRTLPNNFTIRVAKRLDLGGVLRVKNSSREMSARKGDCKCGQAEQADAQRGLLRSLIREKMGGDPSPQSEKKRLVLVLQNRWGPTGWPDERGT